MRIIQAANHFYPCIGGIEKVVMELSKGLMKEGHEVRVIALNKCAYSENELPEKETIEGIVVERIPFLNLKYYKIAASVLGKIRDCDAVHVHGTGFFSDFLLLTKPLHKKPVIISTHGGIFHTKSIMPLKWIYFNIVQRLILNLADKVIAVSKSDGKLFGKICMNLIVIENGVDVEKFAGPGKKKEENTFLFVGRLSKNKRIDLLLASFAQAAKQVSDARLFIVGEDWEGIEEELKKKAETLGIVGKAIFTGMIAEEELLEYYGKSEFFVSASQYEGFGLSLVEAMAAGCIPVVNDIEAFREIIEDGKNGFLIDYCDSKTAGEKMCSLVKEKDKVKEEMKSNAVRKSAAYSWRNKIREYSAIICSLRAKKTKGNF